MYDNPNKAIENNIQHILPAMIIVSLGSRACVDTGGEDIWEGGMKGGRKKKGGRKEGGRGGRKEGGRGKERGRGKRGKKNEERIGEGEREMEGEKEETQYGGEGGQGSNIGT